MERARSKAAEDACVAAGAPKITLKFVDGPEDVAEAGAGDSQYADEIVDLLVVAQRQVPVIQIVQKTLNVQRLQCLDRVVGVPVMLQRRVPRERIHERIVEKTDILMTRVKDEIIEVAKHVSQERVPNCTVEHAVDGPVSQIRKETGEVIQRIPTGRISDCVVEQTVDIPSAQIQETFEGAKRAGQERVQNRTLEQLVHATDSQIQEENVEFVQLIARYRISDCIAGWVDVAVPKNRERGQRSCETRCTASFERNRKADGTRGAV